MARGSLTAILLGAATLHTASGITFRNQDAPKADQCECMNWKEVTNEDSPCGTGPEKSTFFWCQSFYQKFNDNYCLNVMEDGGDHGQWCYVSNDCTSLNGGAKVNGGVNWKKCGKTDKMLRHVEVGQLMPLATKHQVDVNALTKLAYPVVSGHLWKDVSAYFGVGPDGISHVPLGMQACGAMGKCLRTADIAYKLLENGRWGTKGGFHAKFAKMKLSTGVKREMQKIMDSGEAVIFDSAEAKDPPFIIVHGQNLGLVWGKDVMSMGKVNALV